MNIIITAGEISGDILGADLIRAMEEKYPRAKFSGVGGNHMQAAGLTSIFPMEDIAVMGVKAVVEKFQFLLKRIEMTADHIIATKPDIVILIDAPDFSHRVARRVKKRNPHIKIMGYVAPTVWMWRQKRAQKMCGIFDHVLALYPFEPKIFKKYNGPPCHFVGHAATQSIPTTQQGIAFRKAYHISPDEKLLCFLPGSRQSELKTLAPPFHQAIEILVQNFPDIKIAIPYLPHLYEQINKMLVDYSIRPLMIPQDDKQGLFAAADLALAASGTVALELGLAGLPMVIGYKVEPAFIANMVMRIAQAPSVVMVNVILDRPVIQEFLQDRCTGENLAGELIKLLTNQDYYQQMKHDLADFKYTMQPEQPPAQRATNIISSLL